MATDTSPPSQNIVGTSALGASRQLILVVAPSWDSPTGLLQRFARGDLVADDWQPVGRSVEVGLGRAGLAWGRGLHSIQNGAQKQEGDGCAPAGIFAITALFGIADPGSAFAQAARLPYLSATDNLKAIDDPASVHYNRIIDQTQVAAGWSSSEDMLRHDERYAIGAVLAHNSAPVVPGAGSCIFMHVWERQGAATAGCTAMSLADMTVIAGWLDGAAEPVLVQLPLVEYRALRAGWGLPAFNQGE